MVLLAAQLFIDALHDGGVASCSTFSEHMVRSDHLLARQTANVFYSLGAVALPHGGRERQNLCLPIHSFLCPALLGLA